MSDLQFHLKCLLGNIITIILFICVCVCVCVFQKFESIAFITGNIFLNVDLNELFWYQESSTITWLGNFSWKFLMLIHLGM